MALPSDGFSLQDVIDEITKYGTVTIPPEYPDIVKQQVGERKVA